MSDREPLHVHDDEAEQSAEDRRLREVRQQRKSMQKQTARRGRDLLAAGGAALAITSLYCLVLVFQKAATGPTGAIVAFGAFAGVSGFLSFLCLRLWKRGR